MHVDKYGCGWPDAYAARGFWLAAKVWAGILAALLLGAALSACGPAPEPASPQITDAQFRDIVDGTHGRALEALALRVAALEAARPVNLSAMTEADGR
jgi:hypothetical protein